MEGPKYGKVTRVAVDKHGKVFGFVEDSESKATYYFHSEQGFSSRGGGTVPATTPLRFLSRTQRLGLHLIDPAEQIGFIKVYW